MTDDGSETPARLLATATAAGRLTRTTRHGFWFPLVLFGLLVIGAGPWYRIPPLRDCPPEQRMCGFILGHQPPNTLVVTLYWLVAACVGYVATLGYYRLRARRVGVAGRIWPYLVTGLVLLTMTLLATPTVGDQLPRQVREALSTMPGNLLIRGMTPLLALAVGLFVLARLERSPALAWFALLFLTVAFVSNLYDVENQSPRIGWTPADQWHLLPNLWLAGFTLLLGGLGFGIAQLLRDRSRVRREQPA